jgi:hypothetical protein
MGYADEFVKLIDRDWYRIADFYRATDRDAETVRDLWADQPSDD